MSRRSRPGDLPERQVTIRAALRRVLGEGLFSAHEISGRVGISEKDVAEHLEHLSRSLKSTGERLAIEPARCRACGFTFKDRERFGKPSRCPLCKHERLAPARYRIVLRGGGPAAPTEPDGT